MSRRRYAGGPTTRERRFDPPLTIGVVADTHIYQNSGRQIPQQVVHLFQRASVQLIVHLGDANTRSVLEDLAHIAPLIAVHGNNDDDELMVILPETTRFAVGKHWFGVIHGHGGKSGRQVAVQHYAGKVDCVLFGHSHQPLIDQVGDLVLFNPGSVTDRRWHQHFGVGIIRVTADRIEPDLILFTAPDHLVNITFESA